MSIPQSKGFPEYTLGNAELSKDLHLFQGTTMLRMPPEEFGLKAPGLKGQVSITIPGAAGEGSSPGMQSAAPGIPPLGTHTADLAVGAVWRLPGVIWGCASQTGLLASPPALCCQRLGTAW